MPDATPSTAALESLMRFVNNRFDHGADGYEIGCESGSFSVSGGTMAVEGLRDGQYFWVEGSALNDGLHAYPPSDMADEDFDGRVVFLRVPRAFAALAAEIEAWCSANSEIVDSPLQSESFGGYSYTRAQGGSSGNEMPSAAWQTHFGAEARPYRKLSRDWT